MENVIKERLRCLYTNDKSCVILKTASNTKLSTSKPRPTPLPLAKSGILAQTDANWTPKRE